jgi:phytoene/squalene synthetase
LDAVTEIAGIEKQVRALCRRRREEVKKVVAEFRRLPRGRRRELGAAASYLVSLLEVEVKQQVRAARRRAALRVKKVAGK